MSDLSKEQKLRLAEIVDRLNHLAPMWQGLYGKQANQAFSDATFLKELALYGVNTPQR